MKKYTFLILIPLVFLGNMIHSMQYPKYTYNPAHYKDMPLHMAVYLGNPEEVESLLKSNTPPSIDVNQQDINGDTPLHIAAGKGYIKIAQLLLAYDAQDKVNRYSYSAADIATANQHYYLWRILTEHWINDMNKLL